MPKQPEGFTLLLSWLSSSYCPSNTALLALSAVFRCFSQMMFLSSCLSYLFNILQQNSCSRLSFTACKYWTQMSLGNCTLVVFTVAEIKSEKENLI